MASSKVSSFVFFAVCLLLLSQGSLAQIRQQRQQRQLRVQRQCSLERLSTLRPTRRVESEAGVTEYWDENNEQMECAGVQATRHTIEPRGLHLPSFSNAPRLIYFVQGRGIMGAVIPGCPESFQYGQQQFQGSERGPSQRFRDQHQKVRFFRQGDIIALPAGVAYWTYNDGETPVVAVAVHDTGSYANQLDQNLRKFHLAGREIQSKLSHEHESTPQQSSSDNIFNGFDVQRLAEAFGISTETARKLQNQEDFRGHIVRVERGLEMVRPSRTEEEEEKEEERRPPNGLEQTVCTMRLRHNIADPRRADVYSPQGGRLTTVNSQKLPILQHLQISAQRGVLYRNALFAPQWHANHHSVVYITRGSSRVEIVGQNGRPVFNDEVRQGDMVIVPQMFAVMTQAGNEGCEWISFKTNGNPISNPINGKDSVFRALPEDVLANSYMISRDEARRLKYNRAEETVIFGPRAGSQQRRGPGYE